MDLDLSLRLLGYLWGTLWRLMTPIGGTALSLTKVPNLVRSYHEELRFIFKSRSPTYTCLL